MSNFGEVQYDEAQQQAGTNGTGPAESVVIDPNDPLLTSEPLDMNLDANAYDVPPPPPDGWWRATLKQVDINDKAGKPQRHITSAFQEPYRPFYAINVAAYLADLSGKYDSLEMVDYWVKTAVNKRSKTSQAASIGVAVGQREALAQARSQGDVLAILEKALAAEPQVLVQTQWQWACRACDDAAGKKGKSKPGTFRREMLSAASDGKGGRNPVTSCPSCGGQCRAQSRVVNYAPLAGGKATQGLGGK